MSTHFLITGVFSVGDTPSGQLMVRIFPSRLLYLKMITILFYYYGWHFSQCSQFPQFWLYAILEIISPKCCCGMPEMVFVFI